MILDTLFLGVCVSSVWGRELSSSCGGIELLSEDLSELVVGVCVRGCV